MISDIPIRLWGFWLRIRRRRMFEVARSRDGAWGIAWARQHGYVIHLNTGEQINCADISDKAQAARGRRKESQR